MIVKPLGSMTRTLSFLLGVNLVLSLIAVAVGAYDYYSYSILPLEVDPSEVVLPSDAAIAIVGLGQTFLAIMVGMTFLLWVYRANKNLHALSARVIHFTPGWSVGWYFVPIGNLYKPYQVMKEIWDISHGRKPTSPALVNLWWILCLASAFAGRFAYESMVKADSTADYLTSALVSMVSDGTDVLLSLVTFLLVTRLGKVYSENFDEAEPIHGGRESCSSHAKPTNRGPDSSASFS